MGITRITEFLTGHSPAPHAALTWAEDRQHLFDVERIAKSLAKQGGAPAHEWQFFVGPAESLIRLSRKWYAI